MSKSSQGASSAPTSMLSHPTDGSSANCLAQAVGVARDGIDEIVFLSAPHQAGTVGHVVLRDARTGTVRDPSGSVEQAYPASMENYFQDGRRLVAMLPAALVRALLRLAPPKRATVMEQLGEPLAGMAHLAFGVDGTIGTRPPPSSGGQDSQSHPSTEATDTHVAAWLAALGNAVSDDDKKALAQTGDDATTLENWFNSFRRGDPKLNDMPQPIADAESRLLANDAVAKRLMVNGQVTRDALGGFLNDLDSSADSAKSSWQSFQNDNKTPDPLAKQEAADASILQGNMAVLDAAGGPNAKIDQKFNVDDLKAVTSGSSDSHLPAALKNAAAFYANSGEFSTLATAGLDPSATSDGTIKNSNLDSYLSKGTSKSEDDTISGLKSAAIQQAVADAGGDASKLNPDYFKTGKSDASGADKAAALIQLSQTIGRYNQGEAEYGQKSRTTPNPNDPRTPGGQRNDFINAVQDKINKLSQDPDVQSFLAGKMPGAVSAIVQSDPGMAAAAKNQYAAATSTQALEDAFGQKDSNGNAVSTTDALTSFVGKANFYSQALGLGASGSASAYNSALAGAPQDIQDKVKVGYDYIVGGQQISDLVKAGTPEDQAIIQSVGDKAVYDSVLDPTTVKNGSDAFNEVVGQLGRNDLVQGQSVADMLKGLGIGSGSVDDHQLLQLIDGNLNTLAAPGSGVTASAVVTYIRQVNDLMRGGLKFDDAMSKVKNDWTALAPQGASDAYKNGVFHAASAVLLAGAMGARLGASGNSNSLQTASQSFSVAGLLTEGGAKYYAQNYRNMFSNTTLPNIGKEVENVGKGLGGVAGNALGFAAGIIGAAQAAGQGDVGAAAAQGVFAGLNGISMVATTGEIATFVIPKVIGATGEALAPWTFAAGIFGAVGGAIGAVAAVGGFIYAIISSIQAGNRVWQDENAWYKQLVAGFAPSGVAVPSLETLLAPADGLEPPDKPPVGGGGNHPT